MGWVVHQISFSNPCLKQCGSVTCYLIKDQEESSSYLPSPTNLLKC